VITGAVNASGEPRIRLFLHGSGGILHEIEAVVDTGFNGFLSLDQPLIGALGLAYERQERTMIANGVIEECAVYSGTVVWDGGDRNALIQSANGGPLLGTALIEGYELRVQMREGGAVTLTQMP